MNYEPTHTRRYQYRRMGLVPYKLSPVRRKRNIIHDILAYVAILAFVIIPSMLYSLI